MKARRRELGTEGWSPLDRLLYDVMFFIELHLATTEYSGEPLALASGERLDSGIMVMSVLQEIAEDLYGEN